MISGFLPRNPSKTETSGHGSAFLARKISSKSQVPPLNNNHRPGPVVPKASSPKTGVPREYEQELQQRLAVAQQGQTAWYDRIMSEAYRQHALRREDLQAAREELYRHAKIERQVQEEAERRRSEARRARLREEAEQRRLEDERIRRERAEFEATRLAQIAAEQEERRRQTKEVERI